MIRSITLFNFQSHKLSRLLLHPGVNVIVGPSNSGKTAILRGLNWVVNNRPLGDSMVRHGRKKCAVKTEIRGKEIIRRRGPSKNIYQMAGADYNALGGTVPDAIEKMIGIGGINWQRQLDAPFLLSESSGEAARVLNRATGLDKIDVSLANLNSWKLETSKNLFHSQEATTSWKQEIKSCSGVLRAGEDMIKLEGLWKKIEELRKRVWSLQDLVDLRIEIKRALSKHKLSATLAGEATEIVPKMAALTERHNKLKDLLRQREDLMEGQDCLRLEALDLEQKVEALKIKTCPTCGQVWDGRTAVADTVRRDVGQPRGEA